MPIFRITEDDLTGPEIAALLQLHLDEMHRWSPPGSVWKPGGPITFAPRASSTVPMALPNARHLRTTPQMTSVFV